MSEIIINKYCLSGCVYCTRMGPHNREAALAVPFDDVPSVAAAVGAATGSRVDVGQKNCFGQWDTTRAAWR